MEKIKALLYCNKKPHNLFNTYNGFVLSDFVGDVGAYNGKIVIECDYEVEKIIPINVEEDDYDYGLFSGKDLLKESCLSNYDIFEYLQDDDGEIFNKGYAIPIKNLNIFDKPRELSDYWKKGERVKNAPKNMMLVQNIYEDKIVISLKEIKAIKVEKKVLISVSPEEMCRICNGEQTILVRKKVLKEMVK